MTIILKIKAGFHLDSTCIDHPRNLHFLYKAKDRHLQVNKKIGKTNYKPLLYNYYCHWKLCLPFTLFFLIFESVPCEFIFYSLKARNKCYFFGDPGSKVAWSHRYLNTGPARVQTLGPQIPIHGDPLLLMRNLNECRLHKRYKIEHRFTNLKCKVILLHFLLKVSFPIFLWDNQPTCRAYKLGHICKALKKQSHLHTQQIL